MHKPRCLKCGKPLPLQTAADGSDSKPRDGDVAICIGCGEAMLFQGASFVLPTPEQFAEMMTDKDVVSAMTIVAIRLSGANDPAAVVFGDNGHATVLAPEPDEICEMCGNLDECRSYGPRKPDGVRMRVCFDCARKDEAEMHRAFEERVEGRNPV